MLIRQENKKSATFTTSAIVLNEGFKFHQNVSNRYVDLLMMSVNLSNTTILNNKSADFRCIVSDAWHQLNARCRFDQKKQINIKYKNLLSYIKVGKEISMFGNIEIKKNTFFRYKSSVPLRDLDIEKVLVSNKISFRKKAISIILATCIIIIKLSRYI